ncbi:MULTISPECIES: phage head morphogenesis protein [Butyricimonas]|uniref:phage head morphogenesis protein n=1 Tax=Butyricimonas TaxID=574697 RepID=UPI001D0983A0|nr:MULTISPECIES: phage minor head protein [Butyricimonas]MCB6971837.1 minor capsid protein [Butyricimonas synergistica]MCG4518845.1 minor capsid protein [Butyricimonas sp. DFI.6.44]
MTGAITRLYALAGCELTINDESNEADSLIEPYLEGIYSGELNGEEVLEKVYFHNAKVLLDGYEKGYNKRFFSPDWTVKDNNLLTRVQNNIFAFSGAKSYAEMKELRDAVHENGNRLSFTDYKRRARKINVAYNENYLEAERQVVISSGTQGSRWLDIEDTVDEYPYLEYVTANDEHVREEHRRLHGIILPVNDPFWNYYYPPNGWRCRCSTRKRSEREYEQKKQRHESRNRESLPDSEQAQKIAGKVVAKPFRHNVGTSEIFDKDGHPYFKANAKAKAVQLAAVKNYGMKPVKEIYGDVRNLSRYKGEIKNEIDFMDYWNILESHHGKPGEGFRLVDKKNKILATFDNDLKAKILSRERYSYFDEVIEVFTSPDEIWGTYNSSERYGTEFFDVYVKYYEDKPIVLLVNEDGRVDSFYKLKTVEQVEQFRAGLLKQRK